MANQRSDEENILLYLSCSARETLYAKTHNGRFVFENPVYSADFVAAAPVSGSDAKSQMRLKDFLASIPSFADFSDQQLLTLEQKATIKKFKSQDIIFYQGERGDAFYVIHEGSVDILIQENFKLIAKGDLGKVVNRLTEGCYFGDRALMTSEARAASIKVIQDTVCLVFSRAVFEEIISGSSALIGNASDTVDWSKDHETRSLFKHIESVLEIDGKATSPQIRRVLYELSTAFTPELSVDEIISRMVMTVKTAMKVDRVGLFVLSEDRRSMVLKVSERSKGIRLPLRGLAGAVLTSNQAVNIVDAYQDSRFDATMDRRTGYRTRQVLGVPLRHPVSGETVGLLQVNNRLDGSHDAFSAEQQRVLELAAEQLSELLHGRAEAFINSGVTKSSDSSSSSLSTADISQHFQADLSSVTLSSSALEIIAKEGLTVLEVTVALYLAVSPLCDPQTVLIDMPKKAAPASSMTSFMSRSSVARTSDIGNNLVLARADKINFNIAMKDLPRAARLFVKIGGRKKAGMPRVALGWAAVIVFDFKGCCCLMGGEPLQLKLFPGDIAVPIKTTLSNDNDINASTVCVTLGSDFGSNANLRINHSLPAQNGTIDSETEKIDLTDAHLAELNRILQLSFNPLCMTIFADADKEFLWDLRYNIFNRPELLPAFVMSVRWQSTERVQELYNLLDIWAAPSPVQALQLLDRRFMDPKVRAYAAHCLEELNDEELALYMLQLCQQLKFENHIDSALSRFLLRRALTNQRLIGHIFFWLLQSELYNLDVKNRYSVLLQIYIRNCSNHRIELGHQMFVMKRLERVAEQVCKGESKTERLEILKEQLRLTVLPPDFQLPLNPHIRVKGIDISRCRVMESKKKPLWLTMYNAQEGGQDIVLMLKVGDDLRQDALILQLLRVMNELWRREGLDMQMMLYDCISTGFERGLLQVVLRANTLGNILLGATDKNKTKSGGTVKSGTIGRKLASAMKALGDFNVMKDWIWEQVVAEMDDADESAKLVEMERRTQNFMISTAAYCVASYVLGLGDRHNDNLMITKSAHFFHIDFGHILGNFKSKMGVKRERAPFVFTPAMKAVMRPDQYEAFIDLCCDVYNVLRENASLLVSLCSLAIPCNLPELQEEKDVMWIYEKLLVGATDEEASEHFRRELEISLNTFGTRLNDAAHMIAHA